MYHAGEEADALVFLFRGGMAKPVMAHRMNFGRQDVAQVTTDELDSIESEEFLAPAFGAILSAEHASQLKCPNRFAALIFGVPLQDYPLSIYERTEDSYQSPA